MRTAGLASDLCELALDATRLFVVVADRDGTVLAVSGAVESMIGGPIETRKRAIWELAALAEERALLEAAFRPLTPETLPSSLLFHLRTAAPPPRVVDWDLRVFRRPDGEPAVAFVGIDLSARRATEQHLGETEALQRLVLDRLPAVIWATDRELRFTLSTGGDLATLGLGPGQVSLVGTSLWAYFQTRDPGHPGIAPHLRALQGESVTFEMRWLDQLFQTRVEPLRDRDNNIVGSVGLAVNVTEQAKTREALQTSEAQLRRLINSNIIGIAFFDEGSRITDANDAFLNLVGYSRDELRSGVVSWRALTPPEYQAADDRAMAQVWDRGQCTPYEKEYVTKDGTRVPVLIGAVTLEHPPGPHHGIAFILDIREQARLRAARDQLILQEQGSRIETEEANARLLLVLDGSKRLAGAASARAALEELAELVLPALADWSCVVQRTEDGRLTIGATAHEEPSKQDLLDRLGRITLDPAAPEGPSRPFRTGEPALYENITLEQLSPSAPEWPIVGTRDPEHLHAIRELGLKSLLCVPIESRGRVDAVLVLASAAAWRRYGPEDVALAKDLAARAAVSLENARLLSEALDAVRTRDDFMSIAAHELRTPLTSLLLHLQLVAQAFAAERIDANAVRRGVAIAERQVRRLTSLVDSLLDVTRLATHTLQLNLEEVDLRQLVDGVTATFAAELRRTGCELFVRIPDGISARWDPARVEQVLTNLLSNAMKFGAGRPIEVTAEASDSVVRISVRDHGVGIAKADQARIFDRFERAVTSRHFGGLGLGLYISNQIVRALRGSLLVESEPGQGARFTVELPRDGAPVATREERTEAMPA